MCDICCFVLFGLIVIRMTACSGSSSAAFCFALRCSVTGAHVAPSNSKAIGGFPSRPRMGYDVPRQQGSQNIHI